MQNKKEKEGIKLCLRAKIYRFFYHTLHFKLINDFFLFNSPNPSK